MNFQTLALAALIITALIEAAMIIRLRREKKKAHEHAYQDHLTGLANRWLFNDRIDQAFALVRRKITQGKNSNMGILAVDIDNFKSINDNLGHNLADEVLKQISSRLRACAYRATDTVARTGGDEFMIILSDVEDVKNCKNIAEKILKLMEAPMFIGGQEISVGLSIGVASYPRDGADPEEVKEKADNALYDAKRSGKNKCVVFSQKSSEEKRLHIVK